MTYHTTASRSFCGRQIDKEDRPEGMEEVFGIGSRNTKYMGVQLKVAPNWDRTACRYTNDYVQRPLGDSDANRELAKTYKNRPGGAGGRSSAKIETQTHYMKEFGK